MSNNSLGATARRDLWWLEPAGTFAVLVLFIAYAAWVGLSGTHYEWGPYLSPFYSPLFKPTWWPFSPAILVLIVPLGFRTTCYFYRRVYYRAFFMDPPACAVGEARKHYEGETKLLVFQNFHRFFVYLAVVFLVFFVIDDIHAMMWPINGILPNGQMAPGPKTFGIGLGTIIMVLDLIFLSFYTFGCHFLRHLVGGSLDCFSCSKTKETRHGIWKIISKLNEHHMAWGWISLGWVTFTDLYIRLCSMGIIHDVRIF